MSIASIQEESTRKKLNKPKKDLSLLSNKDQEDIEVHQVMMECYLVKVFKILVNK